MSLSFRFNALRAIALALGVVACAATAVAATPPPQLISMDAENTPIPNVLRILAEKGNLNIITGPGVTEGKVSIHMKDVPVDQAINLVVRAAGLAYERIGNSILVAEANSLKAETGLSSYVVELKYADAQEISAALKNLSSEIQVDKGGNRLIVVTSPRIISEIEEVVRVMDVPARQVMLEARIVEVGTEDLKRLGIDWDGLNQQRMVFIEGFADSTPYQEIPGNAPWYPATPGHPDLFKFRRFSRQAMAFNVALDLMIREGNARVLANPKVATLNGREATMLVGSRIPFVVTGTAFAGGAAAPVQRVEKEEVGIKLRITPLINADGYITTAINPEVSSVLGFTGANNDLPIISTRQASTTVRLKDGSSVIIGGLLSEERVSNVTKVPILGSIPVIGLLFQHHSTTMSKKDLVIEVTPHIMPEQQ